LPPTIANFSWPLDWLPLALLAAIGAAAVLIGWRAGALTGGGAITAAAVGLVILLAGGAPWAVVLIWVFVSSSLLSRLGRRAKAERELAKGPRRDAVQVLANTGWGAMLAILSLWNPPFVLFASFAGAMAAVTADTWATEVGTLSRGWPRLITSGRKVPTGTSGAVSVIGTLATVLGGVTVGLLAGGTLAVASGDVLSPGGLLRWAALGLVAGLAGSLVDSLLGATVQAAYHCPECDKPSERREHTCGTECEVVKGWGWLDNDGVNAIASVVGSVVGLLLVAVL
jgi:uncharacterized protein (TIGR00297 family)